MSNKRAFLWGFRFSFLGGVVGVIGSFYFETPSPNADIILLIFVILVVNSFNSIAVGCIYILVDSWVQKIRKFRKSPLRFSYLKNSDGGVTLIDNATKQTIFLETDEATSFLNKLPKNDRRCRKPSNQSKIDMYFIH